jgi:hypothetical protein
MKKNNLISIKIAFCFLTLILIAACRQTPLEKQLTPATDFDILVTAPDTITQDEEFFASIIIKNKKYKLLYAHFDCTPGDSTEVKRNETRIKGCNKNLVIIRDSVKIYFVPESPGTSKFHDITLLAQGPDNKFYWQNCSFEYTVK